MTVTGVEGVSRPPPPRGRPRAGGFLRRWMVGVLAILAGVWVVRYAQRNDISGNLRGWWQQAGVSMPNMAALKNLIAGQNQPTPVAAPESSPEVASQAPQEAPEPPAGDIPAPPSGIGQGEMASLERVEGDERISVRQDSPVYERPDANSTVVGTVHEGKLMLVTGTTVSFLQIYLTKTEVPGYVPMDVGDVLTRSRGAGFCFALAAGTRLYRTPNQSSQILDEVGPESQIMSQADAIGGYALVKTAHGRRGFVTGAAIGLSVVCAEAFQSE
jgi:hypothetical protein